MYIVKGFFQETSWTVRDSCGRLVVTVESEAHRLAEELNKSSSHCQTYYKVATYNGTI